jgi:hypothetical protein
MVGGDDMSDLDDLPVQGQDAAGAVPPSAKLLLRVVYIMGIILVLLFLLLIAGIVWKSMRKAEVKPEAGPPVIAATLPAGASIQSVTLDGDRVAILAGSEIVVVDIRKSQVIARIVTAPK